MGDEGVAGHGNLFLLWRARLAYKALVWIEMRVYGQETSSAFYAYAETGIDDKELNEMEWNGNCMIWGVWGLIASSSSRALIP